MSSGRLPIYWSSVVTTLTFLAATFRLTSSPVNKLTMTCGSPIFLRGITLDFPDSSMKLKVWFERGVTSSYSLRYFGVAFFRLALAMVLN